MSHALRADSVRMILDTYERLEREHAPRDRRLRIEHADLVAADDVPRFNKLSVSVFKEDAAMTLITRLIPQTTPEQMRAGILYIQKVLHSEGMTAVKDPDIFQIQWDARGGKTRRHRHLGPQFLHHPHG